MAEEEDLNLPKAAVNKLIKETVPQLRVSVDSRDLLVNFCNEFIHLVSSESNDICNKMEKKTIMPEHVTAALKQLGYPQYVSECEEVAHECKKQQQKKRKGSSKLENLGISKEELIMKQELLFQQAREKMDAELQEEMKKFEAQQQQLEVFPPPPPPPQDDVTENSMATDT